ncbi:hypothetical protein Ocin01_05768 [Orchesella cincta]|uniref:Uncharacterized protein n=1 Tax=Orchesella cincta TaxID=48709 RepID=A0A1D2N6R0_ORCCI|nr:hypothetical protein Ocin01_05768 [Orchesella cincta]
MPRKRRVPENDVPTHPPPPTRMTRSRAATVAQPKNVQEEKEVIPKSTMKTTEEKKTERKPQSSRKKAPSNPAKPKRARKTASKPAKSKRARKTASSPLPVLYHSTDEECEEMPRLHEPQSPHESFEVSNLEPPTLVMQQSPAHADAPIAGPSRGNQSYVFLPKRTRGNITASFYKESVPDWAYTSTTLYNIQDAKDITKKTIDNMKYDFWSVLKAGSGGFVRPVLTVLEDPEGFKIYFEICALVYKRGGKLKQEPLASVTAYIRTEKLTLFTFEIINKELADYNDITVKLMKKGAEQIFGTTIVRCADKTGRGQMSANDIEYFAKRAGWNVDAPGNVVP